MLNYIYPLGFFLGDYTEIVERIQKKSPVAELNLWSMIVFLEKNNLTSGQNALLLLIICIGCRCLLTEFYRILPRAEKDIHIDLI